MAGWTSSGRAATPGNCWGRWCRRVPSPLPRGRRADLRRLCPGKTILSPGDTLTLSGPEGESRSYTVTAVLEQFHLDNTFVAPAEDPCALIVTPISDPPEGAVVYYWGKAVSTDTGTLQALLDLDEQLSTGASGFSGWLNSSLLAWSGVQSPGGGDNLLLLVGTLRMFLLLLIAAAAVLMIYNAFSISLAERRRTLGMLASAGATPEQRSACIFYWRPWPPGSSASPWVWPAACAGLALTFALTAPPSSGRCRGSSSPTSPSP